MTPSKKSKLTKLTTASLSIAALLILPLSAASADQHGIIKVKITNISNVVFTPPLVALCKKRAASIAHVGEPASDLLEPLAEGGDTSALANSFENNNCNTASHPGPVLPGETVTLEVSGKYRDYLYMASMLLPTNDGFIYTSGKRARTIKRKGKLWLKSYDAGTEVNDEICANIPGPQCGGEGFNAERLDNNFVRPHPGIQGFADVSAQTYDWGEPVAFITVK
ncbi:MAG: spondin domain-containing protein [Thiotrichaceae bacterium]